MSWTEEQGALALKLWNQGLSARSVAKKLAEVFNWSPSRNAVIGKIYRMGGVKRHDPATPQRPLTAPPVKNDPNIGNAINLRRVGPCKPLDFRTRNIAPKPKVIVPFKPKDDKIALLPKVWTERVEGQCNFPVGGEGADTLYCCNVTDPGKHYCRGHAAKAFLEPKHDEKSLYRSVRKYV